MIERLVHEVANQPLENDNGSSASPMHRTVVKLQDGADEAELRAGMLEWMTDSFPSGGQGRDRVRSLREGAAELRRAASLLLSPATLEETRSAESA